MKQVFEEDLLMPTTTVRQLIGIRDVPKSTFWNI